MKGYRVTFESEQIEKQLHSRKMFGRCLPGHGSSSNFARLINSDRVAKKRIDVIVLFGISLCSQRKKGVVASATPLLIS